MGLFSDNDKDIYSILGKRAKESLVDLSPEELRRKASIAERGAAVADSEAMSLATDYTKWFITELQSMEGAEGVEHMELVLKHLDNFPEAQAIMQLFDGTSVWTDGKKNPERAYMTRVVFIAKFLKEYYGEQDAKDEK